MFVLCTSVCGPHGHWLDVCIALQQSVALFLFVLPLVSARVLILHDEKNRYSMYVCMCYEYRELWVWKLGARIYVF